MSVRLRYEGLTELFEALRQLPETLREEGTAIVVAAAQATKADTVANYPEGPTGNLKKGVVVREERTAFGVTAIVQSRAYHAHLYEYGTRRQPPAPPQNRLGTHAAKHRRLMYDKLKALLRREGLLVSGEAA